jgi:hypothetical protein
VNASGVATFSVTPPITGTFGIFAVYSGNVSFATSTSTGVNLVVNLPTPTATTLMVSPSPAAAAQPLTLTATIAPLPTGSPLGTVSFYDGETLLGMGTVNASGVATLTSTAVITGGLNSLIAVYSGNVSFAASTSAPVSLMITPGYAVLTAQPSYTVAEGGAVMIPVTVPPIGGAYTSVVTMSATGLPLGATGTFAPPTVTPGMTGAPTTLTIQLKTLSVSAVATSPRNFGLLGLGLALGLSGFCGLILFRQGMPRGARLALAGVGFAGAALLFAGCNGGFTGTPITTRGSYTVTITGTSGALHPSTTVTVVVQ